MKVLLPLVLTFMLACSATAAPKATKKTAEPPQHELTADDRITIVRCIYQALLYSVASGNRTFNEQDIRSLCAEPFGAVSKTESGGGLGVKESPLERAMREAKQKYSEEELSLAKVNFEYMIELADENKKSQ